NSGYCNSHLLVAKSPSSFEYVDARFNIILYDNDTAHFSCFFSAKNTGTTPIDELNVSFSLTNIMNIQVYNEKGPLYDTIIETLSTKTIIRIIVSELEPTSLYNFTVGFDTPQVISLTSSFAQFYYALSADVNMDNITFQVKLPSERFLYSGIDPLYPPNSLNFTDGSSLIFQWNLGLAEGDSELFVVRYQLLTPTTESPILYLPIFYITSSSPNPLFFVAIFLAGFGVGMFVFYLYHRTRLVETVTDTSLTLLNEAEIEILRVIASSENKRITQKEIQKETNYSKAKVSITLSILEKKGFIKRESKGRTNIVTLIKDIRV
ncbi:MAG: helix-turn-helix transcriptional regulator, partial [Candidatus Freyarchaeota archaeon]